MKILVTGGAGFIGSHIVDSLVEGGHQVTVFDLLDPQVHGNSAPEYLNPKAKFVRGDVTKREDWMKVLEDTEIIFHNAAAVGTGQSMYQIEKYVKVNTLGTAIMLDLLVNKDFDVKKLIVASSMSIYGEGMYKCGDCGVVCPEHRPESQLKAKQWEPRCPSCGKTLKPIPTSEDKPLRPPNIYSITKKDQEEMCLSIGKAYGIPAVALRYFNVYGPRQSLNNPYTGVCAIFMSRIKNNHPPIVYEDGNQSRDFINIKDIVQANLLAMEKSKADYGVFNVGTGTPVSIKKISELLIQLQNKKLKPELPDKFRAGDIRHCYADISKIEKLGFKPSVNLKDGLSDLVKWAGSQQAKDGFEQAAKELQDKGLTR